MARKLDAKKVKKKTASSNSEKILVTSAWPYIHGMPHLGNITGCILPADVFARFCRLAGKETIYVTGSDSHGTPIEVAAFKEGIEPRELAYRNHEKIKKLFDRFEIKFDNYSITDSDANKQVVYDIFEKLFKNEFIIEKEIEQACCENCKKFLPDRWIEGKCPYCEGLGRGDQCNDCGKILDPKQLIEPYCIICKSRDIVFKNTKHLFLDLPKLKKELEEYIGRHKEWPDNAKNQTAEFLKNIEARCITRDLKWGFEVPLPWYKGKTIYVWFDAVLGYVSAVKEIKKDFDSWWKNPKTKVVQFLGKDNIVFHTLIFPAILIGARDNYVLPDYIASSEYLITKGLKFSKSKGIGITIEDIFEFRPADYWRYILMSLYPENKDTEFNLKEFQQRINTELSDTIGNFIHRALTFIKSNHNGIVPKGRLEEADKKIIKRTEELVKKYENDFENVKLRDALNDALVLARESNVYFNEKEPWHNKKAAGATLYVSANICAVLSLLLEPFIPKSSKLIQKYLKIKSKKLDDIRKFGFVKGGHKIGEPKPLFEKITDKELEEFEAKIESEKKAGEYPQLKWCAEDKVKELGINACLAEIKGAKIEKKSSALNSAKKEIEKQVLTWSNEGIENNVILKAYRNLYIKIGHKPDELRTPVDNLISLIKQNGKIPSINTAVDAYNLIALKHFISVGVHDRAKIQGSIKLETAKEDLEYLPVNSVKPDTIQKGEYYWRDDKQVLCRLDVKQSNDTKIGLDSHELVVLVQGNDAITNEKLKEITKEICESIVKYNGGSYNIIEEAKE